jgi:hypothetical protein
VLAAAAYMKADGDNRFLRPLILHFGDTPLDADAIDTEFGLFQRVLLYTGMRLGEASRPRSFSQQSIRN